MARAVAVARPGANEPRYFESGYPYDHDQFISIAGAAWAVIALSEALPSVSARPLFDSPSSNDRQGWVETALFGSVDDLRRVLDSGLDANAATTSGGTTLLMMAAAEADKMRLLIERGADVNVRSQAGYTALVIAAQFRDASAAIDLLLDRGAAVKTADERLATMHPLGLAAHAGNAHVLARLFHVGDHLESPIRVNAAGPGLHSPMALAIRDGHIDVVRALLDLGADVNVVQGDDWSPLERAVVNNNLDIARLLIERGAKVNAVDRFGYTPLLLAASIDFGDAAMIDRLLAAGARADATNNDGDTALDLARKYRHAHLIPRLIQTLEGAKLK